MSRSTANCKRQLLSDYPPLLAQTAPLPQANTSAQPSQEYHEAAPSCTVTNTQSSAPTVPIRSASG